MRWFHEAVDRLHVALLQRIIPPVFRHGIDSPALSAHLAAVRLTLPTLTATRHYTVLAHTLIGDVTAGLQVRWGPRPDLPVIVYHHGLAEMPYNKSFRGIFRGSLPAQAHLVAVRAPFHRTWLDLPTGLGSMQHFLTMCTVAVLLGEAVRQALLARGACGSIVVGTSLGGFLALVHHLMIGTADGYVPLLAGPDLTHVMLKTHFHRFLASQALAHSAVLQESLDLRQALQASDTRRVLPLLAQYDRDMLYEYHAACYAASGIPIVTIARGHITGSLAFAALRAHVLACMQALLQKR
jgi:hypothetical protein